ncbi:hypothetical protein [Caldanaerobacter subterraneus]|uniref:Uncharacterized protein n=1 Tax=Caldanaerobacter subterraneus TaxID=911092 RepID=A0A7Y2L907_9THEO|nr:hypothetical protein [Caldanaerobacter subterraneus]NNG67530.1 hypothetical protein [Caldanaerobacter subterraneus]
MKLVNLTPHEITLILEGGELHIPPSGTVARCTTNRVTVEEVHIDGLKIPINKTEFGEVENLPEPEEGTYFIVSAIVAQAMSGKRSDLLIPDDAVRDEQGRIVGARALARV